MLKVYQKGCLRISYPAANAIIESRLPEEIRTLLVTSNTDLAATYLQYLKNKLRYIREYDVTDADIVLYGNTSNNRREFKFLIDLLDEQAVVYSHQFFSNEPSITKRKISSVSEEVLNVITDVTQNWVKATPVTGALLLQHQLYTMTFLDVTCSFAGRRHLLPRMAVVANDHSPWQVGFAMAMEGLGVPVIYVQHAEVSSIFPPLDFTASILRNRVSLETYRTIGGIKGKVFVVSRNKDASAIYKVIEGAPKIVSVGIYPTSQFSTAAVRSIIDEIRHNPSVGDYFVKLHPNNRTPVSDEDSEYFRCRDTIPSDSHIAITGNSSVVVDLLTLGHPVFQAFELDEIEPDYYGFVRNGLVPVIAPANLQGRFWDSGFFDERWLQKIAPFEPSVDEDQQIARRQLAKFIRRQLIRRRLSKLLREIWSKGPLRRPPFGKFKRAM